LTRANVVHVHHPPCCSVLRTGYQLTARYGIGRDPTINRAFVKDFSDLTTNPNQDDLRTTTQ
jgi:hypothetical protein